MSINKKNSTIIVEINKFTIHDHLLLDNNIKILNSVSAYTIYSSYINWW